MHSLTGSGREPISVADSQSEVMHAGGGGPSSQIGKQPACPGGEASLREQGRRCCQRSRQKGQNRGARCSQHRARRGRRLLDHDQAPNSPRGAFQSLCRRGKTPLEPCTFLALLAPPHPASSNALGWRTPPCFWGSSHRGLSWNVVASTSRT